jgi:hypothetical protein
LQAFEAVRRKYKHNRTFYSDQKHICIKEMPSSPHARAAGFVQLKLMFSIISQLLLPDNTVPNEEKINTVCDESNEHLITLVWSNSLAIKLPRFSGEPDGGLLWDGQQFPFAVIEVGVSDGESKTRGRCRHWITQGEGKTSSFFSTPLTI